MAVRGRFGPSDSNPLLIRCYTRKACSATSREPEKGLEWEAAECPLTLAIAVASAQDVVRCRSCPSTFRQYALPVRPDPTVHPVRAAQSCCRHAALKIKKA